MEYFWAGGMVGSSFHFMTLQMMKKSLTHKFKKVIKVSLIFGCVFYAMGLQRTYMAEHIRRDTVKENAKKMIRKLD